MLLTSPPEAAPGSEATLDEYLSRPTAETVSAMADLDGNLLILGAGGKLGLSLAQMARRALDQSGRQDLRVTAVSRFGSAATLDGFRAAGVETLSSDLLSAGALEALPDALNV